MRVLRNKSFTAAAAAHLGVDLLNSQHPLLLAFLSVPLGLTNTIVGLVSTFYILSASISQPLFGLIADRLGSRWVATGGVLWMAAMFGLAVSLQGYASLILLILAALGSAAFHPAGTMEATLQGREQPAGRATTATSIFFMFGQVGLSLGPILGGALLSRWGPPGLLILILLVIPTGANTGIRIAPRSRFIVRASSGEEEKSRLIRSGLVVFILLAALRSWTQSNLITFLPKYYSDLGFGPISYGLIAALFMGGSALGGLAGGLLADTYGKRRVVAVTLLLAALPIGLFSVLGETDWRFVITPLAGTFTGASHSIIVVLGQEMMPNRMATASGLVLGFTFASGSIGTFLSGLQADRAGFGAFFVTTAVISLTAALAARYLRTVETAHSEAASAA